MITPDMLAIFLTAAGAVGGAAVVWAIIDFLKKLVPGVIDGHERVAAFVGSALLIVLSFYSGLIEVPPTQTIDLYSILGLLIAWYGIARLAMATHDDVNAYPNSLTGPSVSKK